VDPVGIAQRLGHLQGHRQEVLEVAPEVLGVEQDVVLTPIQHDSPNEIAQPFDVADWKKGEASRSRQDHANVAWSSAIIPTSTSASPRSAR
jgi:hypothetical protein